MLDWGYYNMDCMEGMKQFPDKFFDLAIVDPEYGINLKGPCGRFEKYGTLQSINYNPPKEDYFNGLFRISKNQIIWGGNYFKLLPCRCFIIWDKGESMYGRSFSECEFAWTSFNQVARITKCLPNQKDRFHPTQKPVTLYRWLLQNYALPYWRLLDTHVGSASSLIAFEMEGFNEYVGFELDADYYRNSMKRLENWRKSRTVEMFEPQELRMAVNA